MLMNAVRDVASALGDLIHATKSAAGKPSTDPAMLNLKDSAKVGCWHRCRIGQTRVLVRSLGCRMSTRRFRGCGLVFLHMREKYFH